MIPLSIISKLYRKNERRLDWMKANPDPTKTPVELWEAAKVALGEVER